MNHSVETPPGSSPNSPSLLSEYPTNHISVQAANLSDCRIESKKIDSVARIESKLFCPNLNALFSSTLPTAQEGSVFMGYMGCDTLPHFTLHKRTYRITSETFYHALLEKKTIIYELQRKKQAYKILATAHSPLTGTE